MEKLENLENKLRTALKYPNVINVIFPVLKKKTVYHLGLQSQCIINVLLIIIMPSNTRWLSHISVSRIQIHNKCKAMLVIFLCKND
ncbi:hypothetical protein A7Q09_03405 [Methylacidiphilum sp. Yel]|nr:hypothetical protein A7Q09_03405 [Methylacidiphilum sp. Yel]